jgi:hypothetical protein
MGKISKEEYFVERFRFHEKKISKELNFKSEGGKHPTKAEWFFSCPFCHEGKSWGRKHRFWYHVEDDYVHCFNCGKNCSPEDAICELEGLTRMQVLKECTTLEQVKDGIPKFGEKKAERIIRRIEMPPYAIPLSTIPDYKPKTEDEVMILRLLKEFMVNRKLTIAPYLPPELYVVVERQPLYGRLLIPFYYKDKLVFYQGRALKPVLQPKYLSSQNTSTGFTPIFNIDILPKKPKYIFLTESPIDAMFGTNTCAVWGKYPNVQQIKLLMEDFGVSYNQIVFVPDNPMVDPTGKKTANWAVDAGLGLFNWYGDPELAKCKDFSRYVAKTGDIGKFTNNQYMESMVVRGGEAKLYYQMNSVRDYWA